MSPSWGLDPPRHFGTTLKAFSGLLVKWTQCVFANSGYKLNASQSYFLFVESLHNRSLYVFWASQEC